MSCADCIVCGGTVQVCGSCLPLPCETCPDTETCGPETVCPLAEADE